eukprot:SAG11_NODE_628_length_8077_cov_4.820632_4_plen_112_part_00
MFPADKNQERIGKYTEHQDKLDFTGITYPTSLTNLPKFGRRNKVSINVYGYTEKKGSYLLQKSKEHANAEKHVDMLLLHDAKAPTRRSPTHILLEHKARNDGNVANTTTIG